MSDNKHKIDRWFSRHTPTDDQAERIQRINDISKALAHEIDQSCPNGSHKSAAFRHILDARMTATVGILCDEPNN